MAQTDLMAPGGIAGGTVFDPNSPNYNPTLSPAPVQPSQPTFNPFGGEQEATTRAQLDAFRNQARSQGLRVDEGDEIAYQQMQKGFGSLGRPSVPDQFDDPYTNLLERIAKSQMGEVRNNPGLNQLTQFLNSQFQELSTAPGFSPAEMSVLNTQAFEPIEELRKSATERSQQRTANRGFLPSSGLAELDLRNVDQAADKLRTQANRDLAINAIDRRDSDLNRAGQIAGQVGLTIPQGQRAEELNLSNLLYQLPRNALNDALAVLNGSPSTTDLLGGANLQAQQSYIQQQQTAARWAQIAQFLAGIGL
jgi:hypothetical protein